MGLVLGGNTTGGVVYVFTHFVGCEPIPKREDDAVCQKRRWLSWNENEARNFPCGEKATAETGPLCAGSI
ncbi:hypothetical protein NP493_589g03042 [Ridgeia piscesae]|uniref:Uncharacterized protein n=1 Tax=Ridgeia piscesae TaxID=27915 RepID=A0AAD9KUJ3_RIDPI|nr:hypothetical protein NP493_589g03042 [Ridgeia piscesae]